MKKRIVVLSDLHCGHGVGLTPLKYRNVPAGMRDDKKEKLLRKQAELWQWFDATIKKYREADLLVVNGDAVDGQGKRSGGTEQITVDRHNQVNIATTCVKHLMPKKVLMTYGTGYHTGDDEDWEDLVADQVGAEIGAHKWVDVNGKIFDFKHHIGSSGIPHGRHTAVAKERMWNLMWAIRKEAPRADIVVRSHIHYHNYCGGRNWLAMTTPALQGMGSKYGGRRCAGTVDFGFLVFDVTEKGDVSWVSELAPVVIQQSKSMKL